MNMERGNFMDIISVHYKDIKKLFTTRCATRKIQFNEDAFNESFIKCAQHFGNDVIIYDDAVRYFWIAYLNTVKGDISKNSRAMLCNEFEEEPLTDDDSDEQFAKYFYDTTMAAITEAFSEDDMMIYSLYKYNGWSENDLKEAGYDCKNLDIRIKNIHRFVKKYTKMKYKIK